MRALTKEAVSLLLLLCLAFPVQAADRFEIDPNHTNIAFMITHFDYTHMLGQFQEFEGAFTYDKNDLANSEVQITIQTRSVDTDHQKRDEHLRSPDFFNVLEFPEMKFVSTKVQPTGDSSAKVVGDLTLLGVTKPVTLDVTINKVAPHPLPNYNGVLVAGISARGSLKRSEFGMSKFIPAFSDEVQIWIEAEGLKQ